ncbi:hypothetical protein PRIPAC_95194 [Pristionchus pacificus]|uniref:Uncharacterized protein n=1 Tax=Pristionchus pacificus TaxID=54126 RepID=A0A2A6D1X1_PRIPA|nr:hypothetical protein PRIPAC_95194 [Pristionchus pacificus]|eukprot:PDM84378.1 hypothetical protein PRIPAC_33401 [Pristionchus pacificus]
MLSRILLLILFSALGSSLEFLGTDPVYEGHGIRLCGARLLGHIMTHIDITCEVARLAFAPLPVERILQLKELESISRICCTRTCSEREIQWLLCEGR